MACAQSVLEGLDEAGISTALAPLLSTLSRPEYVQGLLPHIGEVVDVLPQSLSTHPIVAPFREAGTGASQPPPAAPRPDA